MSDLHISTSELDFQRDEFFEDGKAWAQNHPHASADDLDRFATDEANGLVVYSHNVEVIIGRANRELLRDDFLRGANFFYNRQRDINERNYIRDVEAARKEAIIDEAVRRLPRIYMTPPENTYVEPEAPSDPDQPNSRALLTVHPSFMRDADFEPTTRILDALLMCDPYALNDSEAFTLVLRLRDYARRARKSPASSL